MDAISSWWVNTFGHAHPKITQAITKQSKTLEHVVFANFTHDPAEKVAEMITDALPESLNKVFYSDDGSTAMEAAIGITKGKSVPSLFASMMLITGTLLRQRLIPDAAVLYYQIAASRNVWSYC